MTVDEASSFGQWMRARRQALQLTQRSLGAVVGLTAGMIRKIEADERRPSRDTALRLAEALRVAEDQRRAVVQFARGEAGPPFSWHEVPLPYSRAVAHHLAAPDTHGSALAPIETQALEALRQSVSPDAVPLERLLIAHIARCWLWHYRAEQEYTQQSLHAMSVDQVAAWELRLTATQARYLNAVQAMAWVRRLPQTVLVDVPPAGSGDSG
jgi:transcriptional regulator with XRE-family HTH domain